MRVRIDAVRQNISPVQAESNIRRVCEDFVPQVQKKLYYPYFWAEFEYSVNVLIKGRKQFNANCVVDLINRVAAVTDSFESESILVPTEFVLRHQANTEEAIQLAKSSLVQQVMLKMKSLLYPDIKIMQHSVVYKPFWILKCESTNGEGHIRVLLDAVTGGYEILNHTPCRESVGLEAC